MTNLNIENLNTVTYDDAANEYTLEFNADEMVYIRVDADNYPGAESDEWYFDDEKNVEKAIAEAKATGQIK